MTRRRRGLGALLAAAALAVSVPSAAHAEALTLTGDAAEACPACLTAEGGAEAINAVEFLTMTSGVSGQSYQPPDLSATTIDQLPTYSQGYEATTQTWAANAEQWGDALGHVGAQTAVDADVASEITGAGAGAVVAADGVGASLGAAVAGAAAPVVATFGLGFAIGTAGHYLWGHLTAPSTPGGSGGGGGLVVSSWTYAEGNTRWYYGDTGGYLVQQPGELIGRGPGGEAGTYNGQAFVGCTGLVATIANGVGVCHRALLRGMDASLTPHTTPMPDPGADDDPSTGTVTITPPSPATVTRPQAAQAVTDAAQANPAFAGELQHLADPIHYPSPAVAPSWHPGLTVSPGTYTGWDPVSGTDPAAGGSTGMGGDPGTDPTDATPDPGVAPSACGLTPPTAALDFSPLTALHAGDVFPFSMLSVAGAALTGIAGTPERPNASITVFGHDEGDLSFLSHFDGIVGTIRSAIGFLLIVGTAWLLWDRTLGAG